MTPNQGKEYQRGYDEAKHQVCAAKKSGYHAPYNNISSEAFEAMGYEDGFRDALVGKAK